jgi:hypothetical protein
VQSSTSGTRLDFVQAGTGETEDDLRRSCRPSKWCKLTCCQAMASLISTFLAFRFAIHVICWALSVDDTVIGLSYVGPPFGLLAKQSHCLLAEVVTSLKDSESSFPFEVSHASFFPCITGLQFEGVKTKLRTSSRSQGEKWPPITD